MVTGEWYSELADDTFAGLSSASLSPDPPIDDLGFESLGSYVFAQDWQHWHDDLDERRRDPHGPLAYTGLHWLSARPQRVPRVPGSFRAIRGSVLLSLDPDERARYSGVDLTGEARIDPGENGTLEFAGGTAEFARLGGHAVLRSRLQPSPFLESFGGTPAFRPNEAWVIPAVFHADPRAYEVDAAVGDFLHLLQSPGTLRLTIGGRGHELAVFESVSGNGWRLPFTDATSGRETTVWGRDVVVDPVLDGETAMIDFTRSSNLPCAYSDMTTCALAPRSNRIRTRITAGEKTPRLRLIAGADGPIVVSER
ncbi:DUF1684 domain-containing protein [Microbacterium sp. 2MCAF23]|uniref:DUF1684 domain-containing protein n=1 Tax=Microbacterium sp. 2MCAF23 TaxID=3232985 RepID=UPI003F9963F4